MDRIKALSIKMGSYIRRISDRLDELEKGYNEMKRRIDEHGIMTLTPYKKEHIHHNNERRL